MTTDDGSTDRARAWRWTATVVGVLVLAAGAVWIDAATWDRDRVAAVGVCQDLASGLRVPDQQCATGQRGDRWVYYTSGSTAPGMGSAASDGSPQAPSGAGGVVRGGEAESGGEVSDEGPSGSSGGSGESGGEEGGEEGGSSGGGGGGGGGEE